MNLVILIFSILDFIVRGRGKFLEDSRNGQQNRFKQIACAQTIIIEFRKEKLIEKRRARDHEVIE